jgi:hypothetical protein
LINLQSYLLILQPNGQILFETKLVVEKQEKKVGFTFQERKIQIKNRIRDDSIQSEKGSTDHEKDLRNLVRKLGNHWYTERSLS